ncbi:MAG TPA: hypothetical protein VJN94_15190 [Candidatus Binataceae bacterium]|nr:hypothetical protein [Candidatus Binataceae bacterium]
MVETSFGNMAAMPGLALIAIVGVSCSAMHQLGLWSVPSIGSFHGVSFGERLYEVETRYPGGQAETSPSGAQVWSLDEVNEEGVRFSRVLYEFAYHDGMQLVIANVEPPSFHALRQRLIDQLGTPSASTSDKVTGARLTWTTPGAEVAILDQTAMRLIIFGPDGATLRSDAVSGESGRFS